MKQFQIRKTGIPVSMAILFCAIGVGAQIRVYPDKTLAHVLTVAESKSDLKLPIESITGFPDKSSLVTNHHKTFKAFILCLPAVQKRSSCASRVFITDITSGTTYMITGEDEGAERTRPVDELKWLNNEQLSYERWTGPHFGHRYVINVRLKKQVAAYTVTDMPR